MFLGKFLRGRVLVVRNRVRFCQKLKKAQNYDFLRFDDNRQYHRQLLVILVYELANGFADYRL